jgi:hypothetical protein
MKIPETIKKIYYAIADGYGYVCTAGIVIKNVLKIGILVIVLVYGVKFYHKTQAVYQDVLEVKASIEHVIEMSAHINQALQKIEDILHIPSADQVKDKVNDIKEQAGEEAQAVEEKALSAYEKFRKKLGGK